MGDLKADYKCEYAKSNKSSCKKCNNKIEKDVVRIGKLERASNFDGEIYVWHHVNCFASKHGAGVKSAQEIKGLQELKWDDQEKLKKQFGGGSGDDDEDEDDKEDENLEALFVEHAKSGRSTCKGCYKNIANKELRVGQTNNDEYNGYSQTDFYHLACYQPPASVTSISDFKFVLGSAEKKKVQDILEKALQGNSKKRKELDEAKEEAAAKKKKVENEEKKKANQLWEIKEKLKDYNSNELKAILMHNNQDWKAGPSELISRIADGKLNGALPLCSKCKNGHLVYETGGIKCTGHASAYSACTFTCKLEECPSRGKWKEPSAKEIKSLVEDVKAEMAKAKEIPIASTSTSSSKTDKNLFKDMIASLVGDIPEKDEVSELITSHGGTVQATVTKKVTHLIATYDEVAKDKHVTKVANAVKWETPIVSHAFIKTAVHENSLKSQDRFVLWDGEAAKKVDETVPDTKKGKEGPKQRKKLAVPKVDEKSDYKTGGTILVDKDDVYACALNMSDLTKGQSGQNSFYMMQIIQKGSSYALFRKWGRVGGEGNHTEAVYKKKSEAIDEFKKIFYEKTRNTFDDFLDDNYEKQPGKFYPIELEAEDETEADDEKIKRAKEVLAKGAVCDLEKRVADLVQLLFDTNMFKEQMAQMKIDTKKMPVGKLSKTQIAKGTAVLVEIQDELKKKKPDQDTLTDLSNRFYTTIPHDFGNDKPPIIDSSDLLQKRFELLEILGDIETAARMLEKEGKLGTHPLTQQYETLKNKIEAVDKDTEEFKRINTFWTNTAQGRNIHIEELFKVRRQGENDLFKKFDDLDYRKLLWHGSSVAVFAAILSGGLKIMPHAGGRVGAGLYFADMIDKSAQYLGWHGKTGMVLLNEVALGKINRIQHDNSSLKKAPAGTNSVLAEGRIMPDPKDDYLDKTLSDSGHPVVIPQGKVHTTKINGSFQHNEFLIYDQTQVTMKYLIKIKQG